MKMKMDPVALFKLPSKYNGKCGTFDDTTGVPTPNSINRQ